jgi:uncharacterized protein (DUF362 family)
MERNGPSGGSPQDIAVRNTLILSDDPVAVDARAAELFGMDALSIGAVRLGERWGLGVGDYKKLNVTRVTV